MIRPVKLPKKLRAELAQHRQFMAAVLSRATSDRAKNAALETERARLERAIKKLEATEILSDADAGKLSIRREQLRRVEQLIAAAADEPASSEDAAELTQLLRQFRPLLHRAMLPIHDALVLKITRALRPHLGETRLMQQCLQESPAMRAFAAFISRPWGLTQGDVCGQAKDAIEIIDSLLAGENPIKL